MGIKTAEKPQVTQDLHTDMMEVLLRHVLMCLPGMFATWRRFSKGPRAVVSCTGFLSGFHDNKPACQKELAATVFRRLTGAWLMTSKNNWYCACAHHRHCQDHENAGPTSWFDFQNTRKHMSQCPCVSLSDTLWV